MICALCFEWEYALHMCKGVNSLQENQRALQVDDCTLYSNPFMQKKVKIVIDTLQIF